MNNFITYASTKSNEKKSFFKVAFHKMQLLTIVVKWPKKITNYFWIEETNSYLTVILFN